MNDVIIHSLQPRGKKFRKFKKRYILSINKLAKELHRSGQVPSLRLAKIIVNANLVYKNVTSVIAQNISFQEPYITKEEFK